MHALILLEMEYYITNASVILTFARHSASPSGGLSQHSVKDAMVYPRDYGMTANYVAREFIDSKTPYKLLHKCSKKSDGAAQQDGNLLSITIAKAIEASIQYKPDAVSERVVLLDAAQAPYVLPDGGLHLDVPISVQCASFGNRS